ncbi:MAG: hypothetical protein WAQ33_04335 [Gaiellaceae bacterium]
MRLRALTWVTVCALVVLAARTLAYQLAPRPTLVGATLEQAVGGPGLVVTAIVALLGALAVAATIVWLAALGVRERHLLAGGPAPEPIRPARVLGSAFLLFAASCGVFDALESYVHWRAGLGFHGIHCLVGPVHRNAVPLLAALSLVAAAVVAAATHLIRWMRRTVRALTQRRIAFPISAVLVPVAVTDAQPQFATQRLRARGPPALTALR